jgi:hypothetical protein
VACLLSAIHFLVFAIPAFLVLKDRRAPGAAHGRRPGFDPAEPFRRLAGTLRSFRSQPDMWRFLLANLVYNDGVVTIFFFAGIYMSRALHMSQGEIILMVLVINLPSALGSLALGRLADRIGGKKTILLTLGILVGTVAGIALTAPSGPAADAEPRRPARRSGCLRWWPGGGGEPVRGRTMSQLIPEDRHAELLAFTSSRGSSSVLALTCWIVQTTGSDAPAIASVASSGRRRAAALRRRKAGRRRAGTSRPDRRGALTPCPTPASLPPSRSRWPPAAKRLPRGCAPVGFNTPCTTPAKSAPFRQNLPRPRCAPFGIIRPYARLEFYISKPIFPLGPDHRAARRVSPRWRA